MRKVIKENEGITLIALVITIIVLLILAGVSISMLAGENGILKQATRAKEETENAAQNEADALYSLEHLMTNPDETWYYNTQGNVTNGDITLEIGDKITYNPNSGEGANREYISLKGANGYDDQEFSTESAPTEWGILGVENGQILIMPMEDINENGLYLGIGSSDRKLENSQNAYQHAVSELNSISEIYGHGDGAKKARAITVEDINKITGYDPTNEGVNKNKTSSSTEEKNLYGKGTVEQYGNHVKYYWSTDEEYPYYTSDVNKESQKLSIKHDNGFYWYDLKSEKWLHSDKGTANQEGQIKDNDDDSKLAELISDYYYYYFDTLTTLSSDDKVGIEKTSKAYKMIFGQYLLGSTYVEADPDYVAFGVYLIMNNIVTGNELVNSCGEFNSAPFGVRPVVYLDANVKLEKGSDGYIIK